MIKIKTLNTSESQDYMDKWVKNEGKELPDISDDYLPIRHDLQKLFEETKDSFSSWGNKLVSLGNLAEKLLAYINRKA